jgi:hypothetical protein
MAAFLILALRDERTSTANTAMDGRFSTLCLRTSAQITGVIAA